jgi:hypothetical protein
MTALTIGGQPRELRFSTEDIDLAEKMIVKNDGRAIMDVLGNHGALFTKHELEWLLWGAWRKTMSAARVKELTAQFYRDGGTLYELQAAILEALIDSGLYGRRSEPSGDPPLTWENGHD